jgi:hypothetical protein
VCACTSLEKPIGSKPDKCNMDCPWNLSLKRSKIYVFDSENHCVLRPVPTVAESTSGVSAHTPSEGLKKVHRPPKCIRALFAP